VNVAELLTIPASMFPDREILWFEERAMTYDALQAESARVAGALAGQGVRPGDRVAVIQTNTPEVIGALFGVLSLGAVFVPLNYRARREELAHMLEVARPCMLLAGDRYVESALEVVSWLHERDGGGTASPDVVTIEHPASGLPHLGSLGRSADLFEPVEVGDDDLAVLMFTSGTTANAKAVMLAHEDLVNFVFGTTEPADGSDRGSVLLAAPLYHIAGMSAVLSAAFAGRRIVAMRQFDEGEWLRLAQRQRVTHAFLVPTMVKHVLDHPAFPETDLSALSVLSYGAAPMPVSVIRRAIDAFPPTVQFINAFGQTETTSTVTTLTPEDHRIEGDPQTIERKLIRLASIGRPLADVELQIVGEDGAPLDRGQVGEVAVRTNRTMRGYFGQTEATERALHGGWLRTGDLGWQDEDGYVFLTGRRADLIIRGGENIAPEEVELVLASHPAVDEAAVVGIPDEEWGECVAAMVVLMPGASATEAELVEFCRDRLASFKKPERILFVDDLPRNSLGKVVRPEVRAQLVEMAAGA